MCCSPWSLSRVRLFATPWTAAHQASLSFTISQSLLKLMSIESVVPFNHHILCCRLVHRKRAAICNLEEVLPRTHPHWHPDLSVPSFQNYECYTLLFKLPSSSLFSSRLS